MAAPQDVKISLQSLSENKIKEISFDGQETYIKPFSLSESLTELANQIDFLGEGDTAVPEEQDGEDSKGVCQAKQFPFRNIQNHLHRALIEMSVLVDVLSIAQNKQNPIKDATTESAEPSRYLMYDLAPKDPEPSKPVLQIISKKKCLAGASKILLSGANRLNKAWTETSGQSNFHRELLKLRQRWRIRRVGDKIIGDLSHRTAGSDFWHSGMFEVIKKSVQDDDSIDTVTMKNATSAGSSSSSISRMISPISLEVSSDLLGYAEICVAVIDLEAHRGKIVTDKFENSFEINFQTFEDAALSASESFWPKKLVNAQNVLFCRELFSRLTKEAMQFKSNDLYSPFMIVGNTLSTLIFPHTQLTVCLRHSYEPLSKQQTKQSGPFQNVYSIKHALMHLLLKVQSKQLDIPVPEPVSAVFGLTLGMREASVKPYPISQLDAKLNSDSDSLVESLLTMAKHYEVRKRLATVIKSIAEKFRDPDIQAHWLSVSNVYESNVRVTMRSFGYEACYSTLMQIVIRPNEVVILLREGKKVTLPVDVSSIYKYFVSLISTHQLLTLDKLSRFMGWNVLQISTGGSSVYTPDLSNRGTLVVSSPSADSRVGIACGITRDGVVEYKVRVQYSKSAEKQLAPNLNKIDSLTQQFEKYLSLGGAWHVVDWENIQGRHFIHKMETMFACLVKYS